MRVPSILDNQSLKLEPATPPCDINSVSLASIQPRRDERVRVMILREQVVRSVAVLIGLMPAASPVLMAMLPQLDTLAAAEADPHVIVLCMVRRVGLGGETVLARLGR